MQLTRTGDAARSGGAVGTGGAAAAVAADGPEDAAVPDELLRLARWFAAAGPDAAHDLYTAAFGLYGARHLGAAPGPAAAVPAHTSWWHGPAAPAPLPAALRAGTVRSPRGRAPQSPSQAQAPDGRLPGAPAGGAPDPRPRAPRHARPLHPAADGAADDAPAVELRAAARLLLAHPLVTAAGPWGASLPQIRRHADALAQRFERLLGYRLLVGDGAARLFKAGLGTGSGRCLRRPCGTPFPPRSYAALALALSVLPALPDRLPSAALRDAVRGAAEEAGLAAAADAPHLADALRALADRQVLTGGGAGTGPGAGSGAGADSGSGCDCDCDCDCDTDTDSGLRADGEVAVDRAVARLLVAVPPTAADGGPADLVRRATDPGPGGERLYVRRRLAETPAVLLDELTARERVWLRTRQRREADAFAAFLGLEAEVRAEGVALLDPADELCDLGLPGSGPLARAALLLAERLVEQLRPVPGDPVSRTAAGPVIGVPVPDAAIDGVLGDIADEHGGAGRWPAAWLADRAALRRDVLDLLHRMHLVAPAGPARALAGPDAPGPDAPGPEDARSGPGPDADAEGRAAADVRGARGTAVSGWVLLAPAARYAPAAPAPAGGAGRHARRAPDGPSDPGRR